MARTAAHISKWVAALAVAAVGLSAQVPDFADLSLEELAHYDVATLGRKSALVFDTPAPVQVLSGDEMHSNGALTLPEALRLVPGVQVARIDSSQYAIAMRGFDDATSTKLLVLTDGRSVYNQQVSGTNWSLLDMVLEDINRIEVQGGPAGALWGVNAVNGVINIVSKNAHSTVGSLLSVATGNEVRAAVTARQGFLLSPTLAGRVYAKYQSHDDYGAGDAGTIHDWRSELAGTRFDWDRPNGGRLGLIAEYRSLQQEALTTLPALLPPYVTMVPETRHANAADLSFTWNQEVADDGSWNVLLGASRGGSYQYAGDERHTTFDLDTQLTLNPAPRHETMVGANVRTTTDSLRNTPWLMYADPAARTTSYGVFVQDEFTCVPKVLSITAGAKLEHNPFSGNELQPSLRALWHPSSNQSVWIAVSRSARTPSRAERGVTYFAGAIPPVPPTYPVPIALVAAGDRNFSSEHVVSYEAGHRYELQHDISVQSSIFYSRYDDLRGLTPTLLPFDPTQFPPHLDLTFDAANSLAGHTYGGDFSVRWAPRRQLELRASASLVRMSLHEKYVGMFADPSVPGLEGNTPREEYHLLARWHPTDRWSTDLTFRHVGRLTESGVPSYDGLDARFAWTLHGAWELELIGRDLLKPRHEEIASSFLSAGAQPIARSIYVRVTCRL